MVASESIDTDTTTPPTIATLAPEDARALLEREGSYNLKQTTKYAVNDLARALQGGKKADPNVTYPIRLRARLEVQFMALSMALPFRQIAREGERPADPDWLDLASVLASASSDARYLKRLCAYGWVPDNVSEPLRVVREMRVKLEAIQRLAPKAQSAMFLTA